MATRLLTPDIKLLVIKGGDIGKVFEANRYPIIIGRDKCADFVIKNDNNISRKHSVIESNGTRIYIKDLNSTNGTFANDIRIDKKTEICGGTIIIIGNTWIELIAAKKTGGKRPEIAYDCSTSVSNIKNREAVFVLDLHNSSKIADKFGDDAVMKINKAIKKITIPAANQYKARFIKSTGDGFMITFEKPENALRTSVQIMKKIITHNAKKNEKEHINARIGINYGEISIEPNGDRLGHEVNVAFRIEGLKYTNIKKNKNSVMPKEFPIYNRIMVSEKFYKEVIDMKYEFKLVGDFNLKGIRGAHKVFQVLV